jgi:hypothetical protein
MFYHEFEHQFIALKYGRNPDQETDSEEPFDVRQKQNVEQVKDQEMLKQISETPFRLSQL